MAGMAGALQFGSLWAGIVGLILGALFCFALYYVPGILGMQTGMPLYVVGSSTFGTKGGILIPGLLMGFLQIGWHAVFTFSAASFFMSAIGSDAGPNSPLFWIVCIVLQKLVCELRNICVQPKIGIFSCWCLMAPILSNTPCGST